MRKRVTGAIAALLGLALPLATSAAGWSGMSDDPSDTGIEFPAAAAYADELLGGDRVLDIRIDLPSESLDALLASPKDETYYQANVTVDGITVPDVGLRTKGNSSLNQVASSDSDRFSFKIDFNRYVQGQDLLGLTMLNLNNGVADPSCLREFLSYEILESAGIPVPARSFVNVTINGEPWGFYLAVEGIADSFLERWYGTSEGALYKPEGTGADLVWTSDDPAVYTGMVLESEPSYEDAGDRMTAMLRALRDGSGLEDVLDVDEVLRYLAASTVLVNLDGYQGTMLHNYYLYELDGRFSVIPWDYNMSFAGFSATLSDDGGYFYVDTPVAGTTMEARPLVHALLSVPAYLETYRGYLHELVEGVFSVESMRTRITELTAMISGHVENDPSAFFDFESFQTATDPDAQPEAALSGPGGAAVPGLPVGEDVPRDAGQPSGGNPVPGGNPMTPGGNPAMPGGNQAMPGGNPAVPGGNQAMPGGNPGGMMGSNAVPLMSFVRLWNASITAQLDGTSPSSGTVGGDSGNWHGGELGADRNRPPDAGGPGMGGNDNNGGIVQGTDDTGEDTSRAVLSARHGLSSAEAVLTAVLAVAMGVLVLWMRFRKSHRAN